MKNKHIKYILILLLIGQNTQLLAQHKLFLKEQTNNPLVSKIIYKKEFASAALVTPETRKIINNLRNQGYLLCNADSLVKDSLQHTFYFTLGNTFTLAKLKKGNADDNLLAEINYTEKFYSNKKFNPKEITNLIEKILVYYENHGYPFSSVKLDSVIIANQEISAQLNIKKNKLIKIDSLIVQGDFKINKQFLYRYLEIKPGALYNENSIKNISLKLKQLPFAKENKPTLVRLTENKNKIYVFANKKNASQFDGIIGLLPTTGGKTVFTGDAKIKLQNNVFKAGETIELNWRRLQSQTQDLKTKIIYPYIFGSFAGIEHSLKLYRRDTTFIDILNNLGVQYMFKGLNYVKGFYRQRNSNILSTTALANLTTLPDYADITTRSYGLGLFYEKLDYKLNPRKGISIQLNASAGSRIIKKNAKLNDAIYNNINLNTSQYQGETEIAAYIPLFKKSTLKIATQAASIMANQIFRNELFRIGGLKSLRGFDEESIYASSYAIGTIEYRFLFDENSALFLFTDAAFYENNNVLGYLNDVPIGAGAGISFETKAGIFSLSYALGKQLNNTFDVRNGKIHFGIVNSF